MRNIVILLVLLIGSLLAQPLEFRAVKLTNVDSDILSSKANIAAGLDFLASINVNAVLVVVWNSHGADGDHTLYPSAVMDAYFGRPIHPSYAGRDPLAEVITEAHRHGIEVYPWFEMGFSTSYSQNGGFILDERPEWALKDVNGNLVVKNGFDWMAATHPEVQDFIRDLTLEVVDNYDVDGIEYSDRIPAMPVEGGYDSATVALYQAEHDGSSPPTDHQDASWKRWRADRMSEWFQEVRDSVKARGLYLEVSSSPSLYPWSYDEYLQDSYTWVHDGIVDSNIPQLYRYQYGGTGGYLYELEQAIGWHQPASLDHFFAGMLISVGSYTITPTFLIQSLNANRQHGVNGEALFFYEGLRRDNDLLANTLVENHYAEPARIPYREAFWRPAALIVNETDPGASVAGEWSPSSSIDGFEGNVLLHSGDEAASISYGFEVPVAAWYRLYTYLLTGPAAGGHFEVVSNGIPAVVEVDQQNIYHRGWYPLADVYLETGNQTVLTISDTDVPGNLTVVADAAMLILNRKLSPEVDYSPVSLPPEPSSPSASHYALSAYPNPFNPTTTIRYDLPVAAELTMTVFDITGRKIQTLEKGFRSAGSHEVQWRGLNEVGLEMSTGVYICRLTAGGVNQTIKLVYMK